MHSAPQHPATFTSVIEWERKRQRSGFVGRIELAEMEAYVAENAADGTLSFSKLLDARNATAAVTAHDVHHLVEMLQRLSRGSPLGPVAIVVADMISYGMTRMMAALIEGTLSVLPFHDVETAEEWLGWQEKDEKAQKVSSQDSE